MNVRLLSSLALIFICLTACDERPSGSVGTSCLPDGSCSDGLSCADGICEASTEPVGGEGEACGADGRCDPGLVCFAQRVCIVAVEDDGGTAERDGGPVDQDGGEEPTRDDAGTTPVDGGTGIAGSPLADSLSMFQDPVGRVLLEAWYDWYGRCYFGPFSERVTPAFEYLKEAEFARNFRSFEVDFRSGAYAIDQQSAQTCIEWLQTSTCGRGQISPTACANPFVGRIEDGESCGLWGRCAGEGATCVGFGGSECGVCHASPLSLGESCVSSSVPCAPNLFCDSVGSGNCEVSRGVGAACTVPTRGSSNQNECGENGRCDVDTNTCQPLRPAGGACRTPRDCVGGIGCLNGICTPPGGPGEACGSGVGCREGFICLTGLNICEDRNRAVVEGDRCVTAQNCGNPWATGLYCDETSETCRAIAIVGAFQPCEYSSWCEGHGYEGCLPGAGGGPRSCAAVAQLGETCSVTSAANSYRCAPGTYCRSANASETTGACAAVEEPGEACDRPNACGYGSGCLDGTCQYIFDDAFACEEQ